VIRLSIVATLYRSAPHIEEFCRRAARTARDMIGDDYEIILVNDGSPDDSLDIAVAMTESDTHVKLVDLSRNFGHHKAMMTGLVHARGRHIFLIDSDLEEEPEWMIPFFSHMNKNKCDVVYGVQERRKGNWLERWTGAWFYVIFNLLSGIDLPRNIVTARLMTRRYVEALLRHEEREVFLAGLWMITGFDQKPLSVRKHSLNKSNYTIRRKLYILINSVTSFSNAPLFGIFVVGVTIFALSLLFTLYTILNWLFLSSPPSGWTSLIVSVWMLGGMIISFIGVIGVYLSKIYVETKRRPYTIVRQIYGKFRDDDAG